MELINEFVAYVEGGFGFIYEEDIEKYFKKLFDQELDEENKERILDVLRDRKLLIE